MRLILYLLSLMSYKVEFDKEKNSPFECGLDPTGPTRQQFCMKFFLVGVIFLVFDVELRIILPIPFRQAFILLFFFILIVGLVYEWYYGGLD